MIACVAIAGCGGGGAAKPPTKASPAVTATPTPAPLTLGSQPYISPCSVLPIDAVQRIYGPLKAQGYVRQEFYDRSMSPAEFKRETDTITHSVSTVCDYNKRDAKLTSVQVTVEQFRSAKAARRQWASIAYLGTGKDSRKLAKDQHLGGFGFIVKLARENERDLGGKPVKGFKDLLFVRGRADFVGVRRNALIRLSDLPLSFATPTFSAAQYRRQASRAKQAFRVIYDRMDHGGLTQQPLGPAIGGETEVNGVDYVNPCDLLTDAFFKSATGREPTEAAESESLPIDTAGLRKAATDLYGQSPEATCSRTARYRRHKRDLVKRYDQADLSVRVAAQPQGDAVLSVGTRLVQDWIINRYVNKDARDKITTRDLIAGGVLKQVTADQTDADALYVFDSTRKTGAKHSFKQAFFNVGPYAFMLSVTTANGLGTFSGKDLDVAGYTKVADAIAAAVRKEL